MKHLRPSGMAWAFTLWVIGAVGCTDRPLGDDASTTDARDASVDTGATGGSGGATGSGGSVGGSGGSGRGGSGGAVGGSTGSGGTGGVAGGGAGRGGSGGSTGSGGTGGVAGGGAGRGGGGGSAGSGGTGGGQVRGDALAWARRATGRRADRARTLAVDPTGNIYVGGTFDANAVFWDGQPDQQAVPANAGSYDLFLAKVTPAGALQWLRTAGNASDDDQVLAVAAVADGVLVAGSHGNSTSGAVVLGPGEPSEIRLSSSGFFFARYRADGSLAWGRATGGSTHFGTINRIAATADGGMMAGGQFQGSVTFGPGEANQTTLVNPDTNGTDDGYLARFDGGGNVLWALQLRGPQRDLVQDVQLAADGSAIIVGAFAESTVLPSRGGANVTLTVAPGDGNDLFIATYEPNGSLRWGRQVSGPAQPDPHGLGPMSGGGFVLNGTITPGAGTGLAVFGPGEPGETALVGTYFDMFLARYDGDGRLSWARLAPGAYPETHTVVVLPGDRIAVAGRFGNSGGNPRANAVFSPGEPGETTLTPLPGPDLMNLFLAWYQPDGRVSAARIVGLGESAFLSGAAASSGDGLVIAGGYSGHIVFGPLDATPITFTKPGPDYIDGFGTQDIFVAAFRP